MSKRMLYAVAPLKTEQAYGKHAALPELPGRHGDILEGVAFGPRREMIVEIKPLLWAGSRGFYGPAITVRFGGIVNYKEVQETFKPRYCKWSELNRIEYDEEQFSKPGDLHLLLSFERIDVVIVIHCSSLTITEPQPDTEKAA